MAKHYKLTRRFYSRPTLTVAQDLLGKFLIVMDCADRNPPFLPPCKRGMGGGFIISGMIVETEAYIGGKDLACHASRGKTERTKVMFGKPGHVYVYMIYGMYCCLNIVTEKEGFPAAVLIRAIEPKKGVEKMLRNRKLSKNAGVIHELPLLASGPGRLCQAFGIAKKLNGADLTGDKIWIEDRGIKIRKRDIIQTKRIGVDYAGKCKNYPWRFYIKGNKFVSKI
jgi:DNA-3-methyladenine glycosylase